MSWTQRAETFYVHTSFSEVPANMLRRSLTGNLRLPWATILPSEQHRIRVDHPHTDTGSHTLVKTCWRQIVWLWTREQVSGPQSAALLFPLSERSQGAQQPPADQHFSGDLEPHSTKRTLPWSSHLGNAGSASSGNHRSQSQRTPKAASHKPVKAGASPSPSASSCHQSPASLATLQEESKHQNTDSKPLTHSVAKVMLQVFSLREILALA